MGVVKLKRKEKIVVKLISNLVAVIYIADLRIVPEENKFTPEEFAKLKERKEYDQLIEDRNFELVGEIENDGVKTIDDMSKGELLAYAKELGLEGISQSNKAEIIEAIKEAQED